MTARRRLPVLSNTAEPPAPAGDDDEPARPPWHWAGFGTVAIFAAWLPLAYVGGAVSARVMTARFGKDASEDAIRLALEAMSSSERSRLMATIALPSLLALALAAFGGGFIVGRFGPGTGAREAAFSGAVTAIVASTIAWSGASISSLVAVVVTMLVAVLFAAWGGRVGSGRVRRA